MKPALKEEIAAGVCELDLDLSPAVSLNSKGIGLLIAAYNSLAGVHGTIRPISSYTDILNLFTDHEAGGPFARQGPRQGGSTWMTIF
jgi:hypothetical protein